MSDFDANTYEHLRNLARRIHGERSNMGVAVQPTTLVHEAWIKIERSTVEIQGRAHFLAVAARAMRQLMLDRARAAAADKRGNAPLRVTLSGLSTQDDITDFLDLDRALDLLTEVDPLAAEVAVMRMLAGATLPEVATALDRPQRSIERSWRFARVFLKRHLTS